MRRRTFIAATASAPLAGALPAAASSTFTLRLPRPTGPHHIATTTLHLIDTTRGDPWNAATTRELMTTLYYPASTTRGYPLAPHLTPVAAGIFAGLDAGILHPELPSSGVDWAATRTHSYAGAPALPVRRPVLLYSPGGADPRTIGTSLAEDLASHGYVVVTVDHPGETSEVDFPGRPPRVIEITPDVQTDPVLNRTMMTTRFTDLHFVLAQLERLAAGHNPDASARPLPRNLHRALDLRRVGTYGHSAGGATAAQAMHKDDRIRCAANLEGFLDLADGTLYPIAQQGTRKPFLLAGTDGYANPRFDRTWSAVQSHGGPVRRTQLSQANHWAFTDYAPFAPQLVTAGLMTRDDCAHLVGDKPNAAAVRTLLRTFFHRALPC